MDRHVETELRIACFTGEKARVFNLVEGKTHGDHGPWGRKIAPV